MPESILENPSGGGNTTAYKYRRKEWVRTPNFRELPKSDLPINPYYDIQDWTTQLAGIGAYTVGHGTQWYDLQPGPPESVAVIRSEFNALYNTSGFVDRANRTFNDTTVRLLSKVADAKANIAVMAKEAAKTSTLILDTASRLDRAYRAFRKGNLREVASQLNLTKKTGHNNWLAYKYGWMPLLMEVKGAAEFFAQQTMGGRPIRFTVSAKGMDDFRTEQSFVYAPAYGGLGSGTYKKTFTGHYECHQKLWLEVTNPHLAHLQQLGVTNPALYAWEVIPYSFVFDWFISVGDWLQGLTALHGLTIRKALRSNLNYCEYFYDQPETRVSNNGYLSINGERRRSMVRREYGRGPFVIPDPTELKVPMTYLNELNRPFEKLATSLHLLRGRSRAVRT